MAFLYYNHVFIRPAYYNNNIFFETLQKEIKWGQHRLECRMQMMALDVNGHLPLERPLPDSSAI
jgi:hypothetical protein